MKKRRPTLAEWKNGYLRKLTVLLLLTITPVWILLQIFWSLIMNGVPETWHDIKDLFRQDACASVKEAWLGREEYRKRLKNGYY